MTPLWRAILMLLVIFGGLAILSTLLGWPTGSRAWYPLSILFLLVLGKVVIGTWQSYRDQ